MEDNDLYRIYSENYENRIKSAFASLLEDEDFIDLTLVSEGKFIKAHRVILSVFSSYFRGLLKNISCKHPVIIIPEVSYENMYALVQFIYCGDVNVLHSNLDSFLKAAQLFKISGLEQQVDEEGNLNLQNELSDELVAPSQHRSDSLRAENSQGSQQAEELEDSESIQGPPALPFLETFSPSIPTVDATSNYPPTPPSSNQRLHSSIGITESHFSIQSSMRPSTSKAHEQESNSSKPTRTKINQVVFVSPLESSQHSSPLRDAKSFENYDLEGKRSISVSTLILSDPFGKMEEPSDDVDKSWLSIEEDNDALGSEMIKKSQRVKEQQYHDSLEVNPPTSSSFSEDELKVRTHKNDHLGSNVSKLVEAMNLGHPSHMAVLPPDPSTSYGVSKQMALVSSGSTEEVSSPSGSHSNEQKNKKSSKISPKKFSCTVCDKTLTTWKGLTRHLRTQHNINF